MEKSPKNNETLDFNADELLNMIEEENNENNNDRKSGKKRISADKNDMQNEIQDNSKVKKTSSKSDIKEEMNKQEKKKKRKKKDKETNDNVDDVEKEPENNKKGAKIKGKNKKEENIENVDAKNQIMCDEEKPHNKVKDKTTKRKSEKSNPVEDNEIKVEKTEKKDKKNKSEEISENSKPKKDKKETSVKRVAIDEEGDKKIILEYMIQQNRPYSAVNIYDNLHGKIKKANVIKILDDLASENKLLKKEYKQNKIYLASQTYFPVIDEKESKLLDQAIEEKKKLQDENQQKLKKLQNEYKTITAKLTDEELKKKIKEKLQYLEETHNKLNKYQCGDYVRVPDEEVKLKEKNFENVKNNYKKVRKVCIDIVDGFCEAMEMKRSEVMKTMNLEEEDENDLQYSKC